MEDMERYLRPTLAIDCDNPLIVERAKSLIADRANTIAKAKSLFYFVRDRIKYNMYVPMGALEDYFASATLERKEGFCIQKAVLLVALARASGIPSQLHFADIRNYLASKKALEMMGTNLFAYHGYMEFYLNGEWIKATPAFDLETCQENKWVPVEFDGTHDAILHSLSTEGKRHIEYVLDHGCYDDLPIIDILNSFEKIYGLGSNAENWNNLVAEERAKKTANEKR